MKKPVLRSTEAHSLTAVSKPFRPAPFTLLSDTDLEALPTPQYQIAGVLPSYGTATLFGVSNIGKSFVALDWSLSIASGQSWNGRETTKGDVVYVYSEGWHGIKSRVASWKLFHGFESVPGFYVLPHAIRVLSPADVVKFEGVIEERRLSPKLIVLDTLAKCNEGGDENSAEAMGRVMGWASRLADKYDATVLFLHHTGKTGESERGSSALRGAVDTLISLRGNKDEVLTLHCDKMRDGAAFADIHLRRVVRGDSCVMVPSDTAGTRREVEAADKKASLLIWLAEPQTQEAWREFADMPQTTFWRWKKTLEAEGYVTKEGDFYSLTDKGWDLVDEYDLSTIPDTRDLEWMESPTEAQA